MFNHLAPLLTQWGIFLLSQIMLVRFEEIKRKGRKDTYVYVNVDNIIYVEFITAWGDILKDYYKIYFNNGLVTVDAKSFEDYIHGTYSKDEKLTIWQKIKIFFASWLKSLKMMKSSS